VQALLLHREDDWSHELQRVFSRRYLLSMRNYRKSSDHAIIADLQTVDLVIIDVSIDDPEMRHTLRILKVERARRPFAVLCVTRVNRGPRYQYDIERIGARFAYGK
jgi:hypothetical protein